MGPHNIGITVQWWTHVNKDLASCLFCLGTRLAYTANAYLVTLILYREFYTPTEIYGYLARG